MTFTDEDLTRLKADMAIAKPGLLYAPWMYSLIARLESAEQCARDLKSHAIGTHCIAPIEREHLETWRKTTVK